MRSLLAWSLCIHPPSGVESRAALVPMVAGWRATSLVKCETFGPNIANVSHLGYDVALTSGYGVVLNVLDPGLGL